MRRSSQVFLCVASVALALFLGSIQGGSIARGAGVLLDTSVGSVPATGIGLIKLGGGSGTSNNWSQLTNTDKYSILIAGPADATQAAPAPGRSLLYACGVNVPGATAGWSGSCGVSW